MKKQYTKKQIQEAISYWKKQLARGNYRKVNEVFEYSVGNPYDIDNCKASGWVVFFMRDGFPYLPVDFSMPVQNPVKGDESDKLSQNTRNQVMRQFRPYTAMLPFEDGIRMNASFFATAQNAKDAINIAEIDSGAYFGTSCYLNDCRVMGLIDDDDIAEFETAENIKVVDTYVCGNDVVIFGRDALDDNADEWERDNK